MLRFTDVLYVFKPYPDYAAGQGGQVVFSNQPHVRGNQFMAVPPQGRFAGQGIMYAGQPTLVYSQQPPTASQGVAYGPPAAVPYRKLLP